ncbi:G-patch-domain-containing protein [Hesseltinella vesiculosa]|uniref:G-patch-domain-containing protein n=1 Tax=Hesseltinella vesiculosa TaxID=101127 RepID=A0A1X2GI90_9FUNG|nr:G-patch-domain-containing protein [Hesseltinella vesiculosa]
MSSAFLDQATEFEKKREKSYSERRKEHLRDQHKKGQFKSRRQLEQETREQGLQNKIDASNKGMKMMMKMGFKEGSSLGKSQQGLDTPIGIELKQNRGGLGMDSLMKRKQQEQLDKEMAKVRKLDQDPEDFRTAMAQRSKQAHRTRQLTAAVHLCQRFDADKDITTNILYTLLPQFDKEDTQQEEEQEEEQADDIIASPKEKEESPYDPEQVEALRALSLDDQLEKLAMYLRESYSYCFWCSAKYEDQADMDSNCPGLTEDDH